MAAIALAAVGASLLVGRQWWDDLRTRLVAPSPKRFPVRGIDVSHHQGAIDWAQAQGAGVSFAFIKATEGVDFRDRRFAENWGRARATGLITGAYHFFTFCSPGLPQAENFLAVAPRDEPGLPLAVDVEFTGNCGAWQSLEDIRRELIAFVAHVQVQTGQPPLLYTTEDVRRELVPAELHRHWYWIRNLWGEPSNGINWQFWQYSDTGRVPGIRGPVDLNVFVGPIETWNELFVRPAAAP